MPLFVLLACQLFYSRGAGSIQTSYNNKLNLFTKQIIHVRVNVNERKRIQSGLKIKMCNRENRLVLLLSGLKNKKRESQACSLCRRVNRAKQCELFHICLSRISCLISIQVSQPFLMLRAFLTWLVVTDINSIIKSELEAQKTI